MKPQSIADRAESYLNKGITEVAGRGSNGTIAKWIARIERKYPTDLTQDDSTYSWCGVFVGNVVLELADLGDDIQQPPSYCQRASEWKKWGRPVKSPQRGDIAIFPRKGGNHVTIVSRVAGDKVVCCGGNQSDTVCLATYPVASGEFRRDKRL